MVGSRDTLQYYGACYKNNIRSGAIVQCYENITVVLLLIGVVLRRYVTMVNYVCYNIHVRSCAKANAT